MRRPTVKIDVVFITVDVQIDAATGGVSGPDRAGKRRGEDISAKETSRQGYN